VLSRRELQAHGGNNDGHTPLHIAAERGHLQTVNLLMDNGGSALAEAAFRTTPLSSAEHHRHKAVVSFLWNKAI
jgi:ankyrin repeat protein